MALALAPVAGAMASPFAGAAVTTGSGAFTSTVFGAAAGGIAAELGATGAALLGDIAEDAIMGTVQAGTKRLGDLFRGFADGDRRPLKVNRQDDRPDETMSGDPSPLPQAGMPGFIGPLFAQPGENGFIGPLGQNMTNLQNGCNCDCGGGSSRPKYTCEEKCAYGRMMGEKCKGCRSTFRRKTYRKKPWMPYKKFFGNSKGWLNTGCGLGLREAGRWQRANTWVDYSGGSNSGHKRTPTWRDFKGNNYAGSRYVTPARGYGPVIPESVYNARGIDRGRVGNVRTRRYARVDNRQNRRETRRYNRRN